MPQDPQAIADWYDSLSRSYDELYADEQHRKHQKVIETLNRREFEIFVDVGCGSGQLLKTVSSRTRLALGIDVSRQMLAKARQTVSERSAQFIRAEASHLPLQNRIADGVVSVSVAEQGPLFEKQFAELSRIATENAVLSMTVFTDKNRTFHEASGKSMELAVSLSDREQLWTRHPNVP